MKIIILAISISILVISLFLSSAEAREVSPFDFQLDESAVDGKRYSYVDSGTPHAIIKQGQNVSLPVIILPATDKPVLVKFHATVDYNQTAPPRMPRGVHAVIEPSSVLVKPNQNTTINIVVNVDSNAHPGKYALNIVGEWDAENGFMDSSIMLHIGRDFGPNAMPYNALWSPLKQYESGIAAKDVKCGNDLLLVIKSKDDFPACVKPQTKIKLIERGWTMSSLIGLSTDQGVFQSVIKTSMDNKRLQCETEFKPREFQHTVFSNGTSITTNYIPVFLMKPNSTGKICTNNWKAMPEMNYSGKVITGIGKGDSTTHDVSVVADPDTITIDDTNKTIVYTITASKDASGFYRFSPMFSDCGGIPIAIGYNSTHSFDNDFPWLWDVLPCPLNRVNVQITGFSGIDVVHITKEYR